MAYLRAHPEHLAMMLTHQRIRETPVAGGEVSAAARLTLDDGASVFAKTWPAGDPPTGFYAAEAAGLRWLRETGQVPVPEVIVAQPGIIALDWIEPGPPTPAGAEQFGRALAGLHRCPADAFGAPWPGFIGPLPLDNTLSHEAWGTWFGQRRLLPYLRSAADRGALTPTDVVAVERVVTSLDGWTDGAAPARTHGDLWSGNVLWDSGGQAWLIDPAAHGGHRETDLAALTLFGGVPLADRVVGAYTEAYPLAAGWQARVPAHQLHLLLVHAVAFGRAYRSAVREAAEAAVIAF